MRGILWDDDEINPLGETMYFVIPSLHDYPRVPHNTKIDIREYVYTGHTVLLMGGVINIYLMNELFGYDLLPQYQPGPYLWNDRTAPGTPFEHVTRKVYEQVKASRSPWLLIALLHSPSRFLALPGSHSFSLTLLRSPLLSLAPPLPTLAPLSLCQSLSKWKRLCVHPVCLLVPRLPPPLACLRMLDG